MIAYIDSSVLMRALLNQPNALSEISRITRPVASKLLKTECLRSLDRMRVKNLLTESEFLKAGEELRESINGIEWIEIADIVLDRASGSFAVALGTLDAIHLSSAVLWQEHTKIELHFLTHDETLGKAARALGFRVLGCASE